MPVSKNVQTLMKQAVVADMTAPGSPLVLLTPTPAQTESWISEYEDAGCNWVSFSVAADHLAETIEKCITVIATGRNWFLAQPDRFVLVERAADIERAKQEGKLAVSFHFQGTAPFQGNLKLVELYRQLGIVHALMAYNSRNMVGDGCHERTDSGLSNYGLELIAEMNRVGMMVDVTHTGYRTSMETIEASTAPVIMSHSSPRAVFDHERNVPDDQIVAMAKSGGVIGIHGVGIFMSDDGQDVSPNRVCDFIRHTVDLVGPSHVGFGLDFVQNTIALQAEVKNWGSKMASDGGYDKEILLCSPKKIADVAELLLKDNYSEEDVKGILGNNWLRVFKEVCG